MWARWIKAGLDPEAFWDQTFRTVALTLRALDEERARDLDERITIAWRQAYWMRCDRNNFPKKPPISKRQASSPPQSWQQQLSIAKMWTAVLGGTIVNKDRPN